MRQSPYDLFGQVPVTIPELRAWLQDVAGIDPDSPRAPHYLRAYDVANKIARIKATMGPDAGDMPADSGRISGGA